MNRAELGGPLLKAVSRSFYLTIRVLPRDLHEVIGLGYLLARTSDTIADSAATSAEVRIAQLDAFARMVATDAREGLERLQAEIAPPSESERVLIAQIPACLDWLASLGASDRAEIRALLEKIIRGQRLDLVRFGTPADGTVTALQNAAELEEYTYLVAGCVGEFWTRVCMQHLPAYSEKSLDELSRIGIRFGQGLQLVNILRDVPEDLRNGRCYLPADELAAAGVNAAELRGKAEAVRPVFLRWLTRAEEFLDAGREYVNAIRPARVRLACFLPWYLGVQTLDLLKQHDPLTSPVRVKVKKSVVYGALVRGALVALGGRPA